MRDLATTQVKLFFILHNANACNLHACASRPILIKNYSDIMKKALVGENEWSDYYEFTAEERVQNNGSSDFFGLNHYGSDIVAYSDHDKYKVATLAF